MLRYILMTAMIFLPVMGQVAPTSWRKPNITTSAADRLTLVDKALQGAMDRMGADFSALTQKKGFPTNFSDEYQCINLINYRTAYIAYNDQSFLKYADQAWWFGRSRTISNTDILSGVFPGKNFDISSTCGNQSMTGGTFWNGISSEPSIAGLATGYITTLFHLSSLTLIMLDISWCELSALLAEATTDSLYLQAALDSAEFIRSQLLRDDESTVSQYISANAKEVCQTTLAKDPAVPQILARDPRNSGLLIEGLSILSSITRNSSTQNFLNELIQRVILNTAWQESSGIISTDDHFGSMNLMQGLGAAYMRNLTPPALHQYIGQYIAVQFNAVIDLATSGDSNIYDASWTGPASSNYSAANQTIALGALISSIRVDSALSSPLPSSQLPAPSASQPPTPHRTVGAIVGGVFGGLVLASLAFWVLWRSQHRRKLSVAEGSRVQPFSLETSVLWSRVGSKRRHPHTTMEMHLMTISEAGRSDGDSPPEYHTSGPLPASGEDAGPYSAPSTQHAVP
ncbi:hypothetical protein C8R46DRAFT_1038931 [Mycena filopes]|nr:hypothetical protein C8R46DRAFT_1038931 [Mycena filopes]